MADFNTNWWREYRRKQYVPRTKLTPEMIFRRSTKENLKEYIRNSSLAGLSHIASDKVGLKEGLFWLCVLFAVSSALGYCLLYIWDNMSKPLIVTMESNTYNIENIDFPAVAICNINRIGKRAAHFTATEIYDNVIKTAQTEKFGNKSLDFYKYVVIQAGRIIDFKYDPEYEKNTSSFFESSADYTVESAIDYMKNLAPSCLEMLIKCTWAGKSHPCKDLFTVRRTIRGHCCTFNYIYNYEGSASRFKYSFSDIKKQRISGAFYGLNVLMDPLIEDYAYPLLPIEGFEIILFDPKHFPDMSTGRTVHRFVETNFGLRLELQSRTQKATEEVRQYNPKTRNCFFEDEGLSNKIYSMSSCLVLCRLRAVTALCKCTPYFYPVSKGPICTLDNLRCLNKYKEKFMYFYPQGLKDFTGLELEHKNSLDCPECLPDCEHTQYYSKASKFHIANMHESLAGKILKGNFLKLNTTNKCFVTVYQPTSDGVLNRLDVVFYWFELLSNVGGYGGLLLGFSLLGMVEILFYLTFRFWFVIFANCRKYH